MTSFSTEETVYEPDTLTSPPFAKAQPPEEMLIEWALENSQSVDRYLSNLFLQIGIPANKHGFRFLRESVRLVLLDPSLQHRLMHGLYPKVAQRFNSSVYCVEHSMRCAITAAWDRGRPELVEKLLGRGVITPYDKPTNGEMIALVAENVRLLICEGKL